MSTRKFLSSSRIFIKLFTKLFISIFRELFRLSILIILINNRNFNKTDFYKSESIDLNLKKTRSKLSDNSNSRF